MQLDWLYPHQQYLERFRGLLQRWRRQCRYYQKVSNLKNRTVKIVTTHAKIFSTDVNRSPKAKVRPIMPLVKLIVKEAFIFSLNHHLAIITYLHKAVTK